MAFGRPSGLIDANPIINASRANCKSAKITVSRLQASNGGLERV